MKINTYKIKDHCRKNLSKYTIKAFSHIPKIDKPKILDIGCGTGVPALALAEICDGIIYAVDPDRSALDWLKEKASALKLNDRIVIMCDSILNPMLFQDKFDIILAEGLLNVIGFEKGLSLLIKNIKSRSYLIIHDESKNDSKKRMIFKKNNLKIIKSFKLNEDIWWNEYYDCLEKGINEIHNDALFVNELNEIKTYKKNPNSFKSIYYILQYQNDN